MVEARGRLPLIIFCLICWAAFSPSLAAAAEEGAITGTVTEVGTGTPIADTLVIAYGPQQGEAFTDANGEYTIEGLAEGNYEVDFTGQVCPSGNCAPKFAERFYDGVLPQNQGTPVPVQEGQTTASIDAELELNGAISGTVKNSGIGIAKTLVCTNSHTEYFNGCVVTDSAGHYELPSLPPGEFDVEFTGRVCAGTTCEREPCELDKSCPHTYIGHYWESGLTNEEATLITVSAAQTSEGIDATLPVAGQIKGRVTVAALGSPPLAGFVVCGSAETTPAVGECTSTNANGEYTLEGLGDSDWQVEFREECPNEEPCPGIYETQIFHELVALTPPEVKTGIDASIKELAPQVPAFTSNPAVTGVPVVSRTLTCSPGTWSHNPTAIRYGWLRNGIPIAGAEAATYTTTPEDDGNVVTCEVEISNSAGGIEALSNNVPIGPEIAPAFTTPPTLSGTPAVGSTLACTEGEAANYPITTSFAWLRAGSVIPGQAGATYNVTAEDQGALLTCRVTMANGAGSAYSDSNGLAIPGRGEEPKPSGSPTSTAVASPAPAVAPTPKPGTASASNKAATGRTVSITLTCKGEYACQGSLKLTVKRKGKTVTIGTATFNIAVGSSRAVAVKLNSTGEKLVSEAGKKGLKAQLSGTGVKTRTLQIH